MKNKIYKIYPALYEEALCAYIWTNDAQVNKNDFVIIQNPINKKSIICYKRTIDVFYAKRYFGATSKNIMGEENVIIINEFYRKRLAIAANSDNELNFKNANFLEQQCRILFMKHPDPNIQVANKLAISLGAISILISLISIFVGLN